MKFTEFGFSDSILKALENLGLEEATEVQKQAIPLIMENKNLVVRSQTGSGKTFAFALPILQKTSTNIIFPETLIVCPTRELTLQVCDEIKKVTGFMENIRVTPVYGGSNITRQIQALKRKPQIIVGTPGRILDHIGRKTLKLHYLKNVVLDEADEMLNMGFKEDIEKILKGTPSDKKTFLFSATYPEKIKQIVETYLPEYEKVEVGSENKSLKNIFQQYVLVEKKDKTNALLQLLKDKSGKRALIFCNTKAMTEKIAQTLNQNNFFAHSLHGDLRQSQRREVTEDFKFKKVNILVASDVAARGLDIDDIDYVINYDIPSNLEYFLHRMGRTARAGKNGNAITIITSKAQIEGLKLFEKQTDSNISRLNLEGLGFDESKEIFTKNKNFARKEGKNFGRKENKNFGRKEGKNFGRKENKNFGRKEDKSFEEKNSERRKSGKSSNTSFKKQSDLNKKNDKKSSVKKDWQNKAFKNKEIKADKEFNVSEKEFEKIKQKKETSFAMKNERKYGFKKSQKISTYKKTEKNEQKSEKNTQKNNNFKKKFKKSDNNVKTSRRKNDKKN